MDYTSHDLTLRQLKTLRDEYVGISAEFAEKAKLMDKAIAGVEASETQSRRKALRDEIAPEGTQFDGREIVVLVNRSAAMGEGFASFIGQALMQTQDIKDAAADLPNVKVSMALWGNGAPVAVDFSNFDKIDKLVGKTASGAANDILPAVKEVLMRNTPDVIPNMPRHYVFVCPSELAGDFTVARDILRAVQALNRDASVDFIVCGAASGNAAELARETVLGDTLRVIDHPDDMRDAVKGVVRGNICRAYGFPPVQKNNVTTAMPQPGA